MSYICRQSSYSDPVEIFKSPSPLNRKEVERMQKSNTATQLSYLNLVNTVTVSIELISPEKAREWLKGNVRNRRKSQKTIENYLASMQKGNWAPTANDPIGWGKDGALINGQQRLEALILSNAPQFLPVRREPFTREEEMYLDRGRKRTHADTQAISNGNRDYTSSINAVIEMAFTRKGDSLDEVERDIIYKTYKTYFDYLEILRKGLPKEFRNARIMTAIFLAMVERPRKLGIRHCEIEAFVKILNDSCYSREEPEGETVIAFMKWYRTYGYAKGKSIYSETINKLQTALYKFSKGEAVKRIVLTDEWRYSPLSVPTK